MKVVIVEDEGHTASMLKEIIEQHSDFEVIEILESVVDTVKYLSDNQDDVDLLFLDIQLADGDSFEIFKHVDVHTPVVFCTAYDEYSMQAIKNNGIDYILKPFREEEVREALAKYQRLQQTLQRKEAAQLNLRAENQFQQTFLTQYRDKSVLKRASEIALFYIRHDTVFIYSETGEKLPFYKKMEYVESVVDPSQFFRINRQMLVNRIAVQSFRAVANRKIALDLCVEVNEEVIVSRLKVAAFKAWLEQ